MPDMPDHIAALAPMSNQGISREGVIARAVDWVFGYDFFISYSHGDGMRLPRRIKERLEQAGFRVFLDQTEYVAGDDLRRETRRQVVKSRKIVVIGRPAALRSEWVRREVDVALAHGKIPVIVNLNGAVEAAPEEAALAAMARERHWLRLTETLPDPDGEPSELTVSELVRGFNHTRQETKRQRVFATAAAVLALAAGIATWQAIEATRARTVAEAQRDRAQRALNQVTGNAHRRVEALSLQTQRAPQADPAMPGREPQPSEPMAQSPMAQSPMAQSPTAQSPTPQSPVPRSPLQQANDLMTKGSALLGSGNARVARPLFEQAMRILESGADTESAEPARQLARFAVYRSLADAALAEGNLDQALAVLAKGLAFVQDRAAADPSDLDWRKRSAVLHQGLGRLYLNQGRVAEADKHYRESIALWRELAGAPSPPSGAQRELALALRRLGDLETRGLNAEAALALYEESVSLLERLPAAAGGDGSRLGDLGLTYDHRADALAKLGRDAEALESYGKGVALFEKAASADAAEPSWPRNAATTLQKLGDLQGKMGEPQAALQSFRRALAFREGLAALDPEWQKELETVYRHVSEFMRPMVGREAEALETAQQYLLAASFAADISQVERVGRALGTLSWSALLAGNPQLAAWSGRHAVHLAPGLDWVKLNYAHALMLSGQREQAKEIYLAAGALSAEAAQKWKGAILADFEEMKKRRLDDSLMAEIGAQLDGGSARVEPQRRER
jgi:tetratricopeptide (TPR) repeat protein